MKPQVDLMINRTTLHVVISKTKHMMLFRAVMARTRHSKTKTVLTLEIHPCIRTTRKMILQLGEVASKLREKKAQKILSGISCSSDRSLHL